MGDVFSEVFFLGYVIDSSKSEQVSGFSLNKILGYCLYRMDTNKLEYVKELGPFNSEKQWSSVVFGNSFDEIGLESQYYSCTMIEGYQYKYILHNKDHIVSLLEKESIKKLDLSNLNYSNYVDSRLENCYLFDLHKGFINTFGKSKNYCHLVRVKLFGLYSCRLVFDINYCLEDKTCIVCTDSYSLEMDAVGEPDVYKTREYDRVLYVLKAFGFDIERNGLVGYYLELTHETLHILGDNDGLIYVRDTLDCYKLYTYGKATANMLISSDNIKSLYIDRDDNLKLTVMINREKHSKIIADLIYREYIIYMLDSFRVSSKCDINIGLYMMKRFKYVKQLELWYIDKDYDKLIESCNSGDVLANYVMLLEYVESNHDLDKLNGEYPSILNVRGILDLKIQYYG